MSSDPRVDYQTDPSRYRHWKLDFDGAIATLAADFDENAGLRPGYKLKLNSYDLGVDIELNDAINRIRFEHPEVRTVVVAVELELVARAQARVFIEIGDQGGNGAVEVELPVAVPGRVGLVIDAEIRTHGCAS